MDEIEASRLKVRAEIRHPPKRRRSLNPDPFDPEIFSREAHRLIAQRGERGDDASVSHLMGEIEQGPLGAALK